MKYLGLGVLLLMLLAGGSTEVIASDLETSGNINRIMFFKEDHIEAVNGFGLDLVYRPDVEIVQVTRAGLMTEIEKRPSRILFFLGAMDEPGDGAISAFGVGISTIKVEGVELISEIGPLMRGSAEEMTVGVMAGMRATFEAKDQNLEARIFSGYAGYPYLGFKFGVRTD